MKQSNKTHRSPLLPAHGETMIITIDFCCILIKVLIKVPATYFEITVINRVADYSEFDTIKISPCVINYPIH